eukprot:g3136.t1
MTEYVKLRSTVETLNARVEKLAQNAVAYCESVASVAQTLTEASRVFLDNDDEDDAATSMMQDVTNFGRNAHMLFRQSTLFSEALRGGVVDVLAKKIRAFDTHESGLQSRRERKVAHDRTKRRVAELREELKPLRSKVLQSIVDADDLDRKMRNLRPEQMDELDRSEKSLRTLETQLREETKTMKTVLSHMRAQCKTLIRTAMQQTTTETSKLARESARLLSPDNGASNGGHHYSSPARFAQTYVQKRISGNVSTTPRRRFTAMDDESGNIRNKRRGTAASATISSTSRAEYQKSTQSVVRDSDLQTSLARALKMDVNVGINSFAVGAKSNARRPMRPVSVAPPPPPRTRREDKGVAPRRPKSKGKAMLKAAMKTSIAADVRDDEDDDDDDRDTKETETMMIRQRNEEADRARKLEERARREAEARERARKLEERARREAEEKERARKVQLEQERARREAEEKEKRARREAEAKERARKLRVERDRAEKDRRNAEAERARQRKAERDAKLLSRRAKEKASARAHAVVKKATKREPVVRTRTSSSQKRKATISVGDEVVITFGRRLGQHGRVVALGKMSNRYRLRLLSSADQKVVEYPITKLSVVVKSNKSQRSPPRVRISSSSSSRSRKKTASRGRKKSSGRSIRPKTPAWILSEMRGGSGGRLSNR